MLKKYSIIWCTCNCFVRSKAKSYFTCCTLAIIMVTQTLAQTSVQEVVQKQFDAYTQNDLQEKIYLHTDRDFYLAGEICWFKIYSADAFFNHPLSLSKTVYVEIVDKSNHALLHAKIAMKEGTGNGSLQLPVSLGSGKYTLRAYTSWMKNFSTDYFFEKPLTIVNSQKNFGGDTLPRQRTYSARYFPEGGNLVNGIESKIGFIVTDQFGKGMVCKGVIIRDKADTVATYTTLKFGIGSFLLNPEAGHVYRGVVLLPDGKRIISELPVAYDTGYTMRVEPLGIHQLKVTVRATDHLSGAKIIYLFVHTRGSVKSFVSAGIQQGYAEFRVDKDKLGDGISQLTVFDGERRPVCERLYFKYPEQRLLIAMRVDEKEYGPRKKINIHIAAANQDGKPVAASMSMAVYRVDSVAEIDKMDISSYLWLKSDLAGTVESPEYYFNDKGPETAEAMDNLMLTQGWRRFRWDDVLQNKKAAFTFAPEYGGHTINGKIIKIGTHSPAPDIGIYLSVPGTRTQFHTTVSDAAGQAKFEMKDFYNEGAVIVQLYGQQDSSYMIEIADPFAKNYAGSIYMPFTNGQINEKLVQNHHIALQVQNMYNGNALKQFALPAIDTTAFYLKPDNSYLLDNYVRFTTMEEVLREYVMPVNVRIRNGKFQLPVLDLLRKQYFETDPLLLLDGVPVLNVNNFMKFDPLKIRKLEVVSRRYFLGNAFFDGIVNFDTYQGNLQGYELDPQSIVIDYEGLQLQREFVSPLYQTKLQYESRLPDYRNLLYWSPSVRTNLEGKEEVSFYSSDLPGKYAVVIQGLTSDGKTGSQLIMLHVIEPARIVTK